LLLVLICAVVAPLVARGDAVSLLNAVRSNDLARVTAELAAAETNADWHALPGDVTPLHVAAAMNHAEVAAKLIDAGIDVNAPSAAGFLPIHWAASQNAVHALALLIARGANVTSAVPGGITPLHWAAANNATGAVRTLLLAGADPSAKTGKGLTPLHWAVLNRAGEAQILLAFAVVSAQMDAETNAPPAETEVVAAALATPPLTPAASPSIDSLTTSVEVAAGPSSVLTQDVAVVTPDTPTDAPATGEVDLAIMPEPAPPPRPDAPATSAGTTTLGKILLIQLGRNQVLSMVWIDSLRLWFGRYEITNGQYRRFKPKHSSHSREKFSLDGDDQPVVYASWNDAMDYATWLNRQFKSNLPPGFVFRLPTAKEWRTAAAAGTDRVYPWGNKWPPAYGNYSDLSARSYVEDWHGVRLHDDGHPVTCSVFESGENEWGIAGLAGNVWEWCSDWYDDTRKYRVRLGGSWDFDEQKTLRIDWTGFEAPDSRVDTVGFRLVAAPAPGR